VSVSGRVMRSLALADGPCALGVASPAAVVEVRSRTRARIPDPDRHRSHVRAPEGGQTRRSRLLHVEAHGIRGDPRTADHRRCAGRGARAAHGAVRTVPRRPYDGRRGSELLDIPVSTIREWVRNGTLPRIKLGRHVRFVRTRSRRRSSTAGAPARATRERQLATWSAELVRRAMRFIGDGLQNTKGPPERAVLGKRMKGLEPSTFCMASRRSSQLSYIREGRRL
jgi:excisionase family DNA binding protein